MLFKHKVVIKTVKANSAAAKQLPIGEGHDAQDTALMRSDLEQFLRIFRTPNASAPILSTFSGPTQGLPQAYPQGLPQGLPSSTIAIAPPSLPVLSSCGQVPTRRQHAACTNGEGHFHPKACSVSMASDHLISMSMRRSLSQRIPTYNVYLHI